LRTVWLTTWRYSRVINRLLAVNIAVRLPRPDIALRNSQMRI
jgi:hypothetical protein